MGDDELESGTVTLRDLRSGGGQTALPRDDVAEDVAARLARG
ncbi:MAG: hypothetical protein OXI29_14555 [bacterium]|nr:hypothetical protein [bacterium]